MTGREVAVLDGVVTYPQRSNEVTSGQVKVCIPLHIIENSILSRYVATHPTVGLKQTERDRACTSHTKTTTAVTATVGYTYTVVLHRPPPQLSTFHSPQGLCKHVAKFSHLCHCWQSSTEMLLLIDSTPYSLLLGIFKTTIS